MRYAREEIRCSLIIKWRCTKKGVDAIRDKRRCAFHCRQQAISGIILGVLEKMFAKRSCICKHISPHHSQLTRCIERSFADPQCFECVTFVVVRHHKCLTFEILLAVGECPNEAYREHNNHHIIPQHLVGGHSCILYLLKEYASQHKCHKSIDKEACCKYIYP